MTRGSVVVDFCGEIHRLSGDDELVFGRQADLSIDDNPLLHRRLGRIFPKDDDWWIANEGSRLSLIVADRDSTSNVVLSSGREVSLSFLKSVVRFRAGSSYYELLIDLIRPVDPASTPDPCAATGGDLTVPTLELALTAEQQLLLVALCELKLKDVHAPTVVPTNPQIAHRFGWSATTYNRKLDRLCRSFAKNGVTGLVGSASEMARDRRTRLVDYVVGAGLVTPADLDILAQSTNG